MNKLMARHYSDLTEEQWYQVRYKQGFITKKPPFNLKGRKRNLLDVKEPKFNLSSSNLDEIKSSQRERKYSKTILKISEEESKRHKEFLRSELKKNFY